MPFTKSSGPALLSSQASTGIAADAGAKSAQAWLANAASKAKVIQVPAVRGTPESSTASPGQKPQAAQNGVGRSAKDDGYVEETLHQAKPPVKEKNQQTAASHKAARMYESKTTDRPVKAAAGGWEAAKQHEGEKSPQMQEKPGLEAWVKQMQKQHTGEVHLLQDRVASLEADVCQLSADLAFCMAQCRSLMTAAGRDSGASTCLVHSMLTSPAPVTSTALKAGRPEE